MDQIKNINSSSVARMRGQGLTKDMAQQWRDFYRNEFSRNSNNTTAINRVKLMDKFSFKFSNSSKRQIKLILEPWAEEYIIDAGKEVELIGDKITESSIDVEFDGEDIIVYGWAESITVFCDGKKIEPSFE